MGVEVYATHLSVTYKYSYISVKETLHQRCLFYKFERSPTPKLIFFNFYTVSIHHTEVFCENSEIRYIHFVVMGSS